MFAYCNRNIVFFQKLDSKAYQEVKCVLIGDDAAKKSEIISNYVLGKNVKVFIQMVFKNYHLSVEVDGKPVQLILSNILNKDDFDEMHPLFYGDADVFLVCFSIASFASFSNISDKWIPEIRHYCPKTPLILAGTECNLRNDEKAISDLKKTGKIPIEYEAGLQLAEKINASKYLECTAVADESVNKLFEELIRIALTART